MIWADTRITRLGLDLDNTVIDYTRAYRALGPEFGVLPEQATRSGIRSTLRSSGPESYEWQHFQSRLYTEGLKYAQPAKGLTSLLSTCWERGIIVEIVSHKTPRSPTAFGSLDLHKPARAWLEQHLSKLEGLELDHIQFCETLTQKVEYINRRRYHVFVDDLIEVLEHPGWPTETVGVLYSTSMETSEGPRPIADFPTIERWIVEAH